MIRSLLSKVSGESRRRSNPDAGRRGRQRSLGVEGLEHREMLSVGGLYIIYHEPPPFAPPGGGTPFVNPGPHGGLFPQ
jgi:hypothetical protein